VWLSSKGQGCRMFVDAGGGDSPLANCRHYPIRSQNVIAPPQATKGEGRAGQHPSVMRECGDVTGSSRTTARSRISTRIFGNHYRPVGTTDSEQALCYLLDTLRLRYPKGQPPLPERVRHDATLSRRDRQVGQVQLHSVPTAIPVCALHRQSYLCAAPCAVATAHRKDQDIEVDFSEVTTSMDRIAVIATEPLTRQPRLGRSLPPASCWRSKTARRYLFSYRQPKAGEKSVRPQRAQREQKDAKKS